MLSADSPRPGASTPDVAPAGRASPDITHHDLLKTAALWIMIADHIGYYFFPENMWWRSVGRWGMPVWFFLVGYSLKPGNAAGQDFSLWRYGILLELAMVLMTRHFGGLNPLLTIAAMRLVLPWLFRVTPKNDMGLILIFGLLLLALPLSDQLLDYGSAAFLMGFAGMLCRQHAGSDASRFFLGAAVIAYALYAQFVFSFTLAQFWLSALGLMAAGIWLFFFQPGVFTGTASRKITPFFHFCGRYTLEIYIAHHLIFLLLAKALHPEYFSGPWRWF